MTDTQPDRPDPLVKAREFMVGTAREIRGVAAPEIAVALVECASFLLNSLSLRLHSLSVLADRGARQMRVFSNARGARPYGVPFKIKRSA